MDLSISTLAHTSEAHFYVEVDLRSKSLSFVWIGSLDGFLQEATYHRMLALPSGRLGCVALAQAFLVGSMTPLAVTPSVRRWRPALATSLMGSTSLPVLPFVGTASESPSLLGSLVGLSLVVPPSSASPPPLGGMPL